MDGWIDEFFLFYSIDQATQVGDVIESLPIRNSCVSLFTMYLSLSLSLSLLHNNIYIVTIHTI